MRQRSAWALLAAAIVCGVHDTALAQDAAATELVQLERDWDAAFLKNDTSFVDGVLATEFIATYPDGTSGDRAKELANAAAFNQQIDSSTLDEFTVQVHGQTAVVWFTRRLVGPSKGQRLEVAYRYLDVFVHRGGRWQCVASQSIRLPK